MVGARECPRRLPGAPEERTDGGLGRERLGVGRDDHPDVSAAPACLDEPLQDREIGEVRNDHVSASLRRGSPPGTPARSAGASRRGCSPGSPSPPLALGLDREVAIQFPGGLRQRTALEMPGQQEDGLQLAHDRASRRSMMSGTARLVVVLDPGPPTNATRPSTTTILRWSKWPKSSNRQSILRSPSRPSRSRKPTWFATICTPPSRTRGTARVTRGRADVGPFDDRPEREPLPHLADQQVAEAAAELAGLKPKMMMWTSDWAASMSASIRGKNAGPSISSSRRRRRRGEIDRQRATFRPRPRTASTSARATSGLTPPGAYGSVPAPSASASASRAARRRRKARTPDPAAAANRNKRTDHGRKDAAGCGADAGRSGRGRVRIASEAGGLPDAR